MAEAENLHPEQPFVGKEEPKVETIPVGDPPAWRDFTVKYTAKTPHGDNMAEIYASAPTAEQTIAAFEYMFHEVHRITVGEDKNTGGTN